MHTGVSKHGGHLDIQGPSKHTGGCLNIWAHPDIQWASKHMGASRHTGASKHTGGVSKHMRASRCAGGIQTYSLCDANVINSCMVKVTVLQSI